MMYVFGTVSFVVFAVALLVFLVRTVVVAFFTRKDERMQLVVTKSMAHAFCVLFVLQFLHLLLRFVIPEVYGIWWNNFTAGLYVDPAFLSIIVLGIALFINKRRFS